MFNIFEVLRDVYRVLFVNKYFPYTKTSKKKKKRRIHLLNNFAILVLLNCERNHRALILQR